MKLSDLVGMHELSGVDTTQEDDVDVVRFVLDGTTYKATEDPDDGYRSYLKEITVCAEDVSNNFPPQKVVGKMKDGGSSDLIQFIDATTGKVALEVGTDNYNDYYPMCVLSWHPENLACNSGV